MNESEIWELCNGPKATRETRMAVVARIAIMNFDCRLSGGFVRDWVINGESSHPKIPINQWVVKAKQGYQTFDIAEEVIPRDLDFELSPNAYFDISRFISDVRSAGIGVDLHEHVAQRHVFVFERKRGPFMADFVEHHFAALHTLSDFDINTLCIKSPFYNMIGLKLPLDIPIDTIIKSINEKEFTAKRAMDELMIKRKEKMEKRGWKFLGNSNYKPVEPSGVRSSIIPVPESDEDYKKYSQAIQKIGGTNIKIYQVVNSVGEIIYDNLKAKIENENNGQANELKLFHGTKKDAVKSIIHGGLDDRFWNSSGMFGAGAYHADDPNLSLSFTSPSNPRTIFVCKVLLGKIYDLSAQPISAALGSGFRVPVGYNSVKGRIIYGGNLREMEYIVYRYGQTQPLYMIKFDV